MVCFLELERPFREIVHLLSLCEAKNGLYDARQRFYNQMNDFFRHHPSLVGLNKKQETLSNDVCCVTPGSMFLTAVN